jgi:superfamily II DNA or RNA helicase
VSVLHDYHSEIIDGFDRRVVRGVRSLGVAAPTGSGKAIIASALGASAVAAGQRILMLAHRRELIDQTINKLRADNVKLPAWLKAGVCCSARGLLGAQR